MKRAISFLLCLVLLLGVLPVSASAAAVTSFRILVPDRVLPYDDGAVPFVMVNSSNPDDTDYICTADSSKAYVSSARWEYRSGGDWAECTSPDTFWRLNEYRIRLVVSCTNAADSMGSVDSLNVSCSQAKSVSVEFVTSTNAYVLLYFDVIKPYGSVSNNYDCVEMTGPEKIYAGGKVGDYLSGLQLYDDTDFTIFRANVFYHKESINQQMAESEVFDADITSYYASVTIKMRDPKLARFVERPDLEFNGDLYEAYSYDYQGATFRIPLTVTELDYGSYTVNLGKGPAPIYDAADTDEKVNALNNTMDLLIAAYELDGDLDLDKDGVWDLQKFANAGETWWRSNPETKLSGPFVFTLTDEQKQALAAEKKEYYSELIIAFPGADLGAYIVDLTSGKFDVSAFDAAASLEFVALAMGDYVGYDSANEQFDLDKDGNYDVALIGSGSGSESYLEVLEGCKLQGDFTIEFNDELKNNWKENGVNYYGSFTFRFAEPLVDKGTLTIDMTKGAFQLPKEQAVYDTFDSILLSGALPKVGEGYDLDGDGVWDFKDYSKSGSWYEEANPNTKIRSNYSYKLPEKAIQYLEEHNQDHSYYSTILFKFPSKPIYTNPFVDVKSGKWYYDAVMWAVNHDPQITQGIDKTHFKPNQICNRGQVVTFLWRAMGAPNPTKTSNPFKDVSSKAYYYKAVLWAVEKNITQGQSATKFGPGKACTRAQVVTFIWRTAGKPLASGGANKFDDVNSDAWYYAAVLWAVEKGITKGMTSKYFAPNETCTRAQIVTFLYRAFAD